MSEAVVGTSLDVVSELSLELARQLGSEAVQASLQEKIEAMSPAARMNALNHLAGLVTSLETVAVIDLRSNKPIPEPRVHLVQEQRSLVEPALPLSENDAQDAIAQPEIPVIGSEVEPPQSADMPDAPTVSAIVVETSVQKEFSDSISKKALNYLYTYFDSTLVDKLDRTHIPALTKSIINTYYANFPRTQKPEEQLSAELQMYFEGKKDAEIAALTGNGTAVAIQVARSNIFVKLQKKLTAEEINAMAQAALDADKPVTREGGAGQEQAPSRIEQIMSVYGVVESAEPEPSPQQRMYELAGEVCDAEVVDGLRALLADNPELGDQTLARESLKELMQTYAPRWFMKLGIGKQDVWNTMSNIIGFKGQPISITEYQRRHHAPFVLRNSSAEAEFVAAATFLFDKQYTGATPVPQPFLARRQGRR